MMGRTFQAHGDIIRATFEPIEVELLVGLRDELDASLRSGDTDDPAVARLFPTAVLGDQQADRELRSLLRDDLLGARLDGLQALVDLLEKGRPHRGGVRVELSADDAL
jgi:hypothetical protein